MIKPKETRYKGYRFRSRLEARWAVFFDTIGIEYEYEKEGYDLKEGYFDGPYIGSYLPDFWLPQVNMWAEVKPTFAPQDLYKCVNLQVHTKRGVLLLEGLPDFRSYFGYDDLPSEALMSNEGEISSITDGGYPGEEFYIPVPWVDFVVGIGYIFDRPENRFFANSGQANWPAPWRWEPGDYLGDKADPLGYQNAIYAARSARFEYGETPTP